MIKELIQELPKEKRRIANYLFDEEKVENDINQNIVKTAKKIGTSPSMITRTLNVLGFYGWKDYCSYSIKKERDQIKRTSIYKEFFNDVFLEKNKATLEWISETNITLIVEQIHKKKKIDFIMSHKYKVLMKPYINLFRRLGIGARFLILENNEISLIGDDTLAFMTCHRDKQNKFVVDKIKKNHPSSKIVCFVFGDARSMYGTISMHLINDKILMQDELINYFQSRTILQTVMDNIFIKWYARYYKNVSSIYDLTPFTKKQKIM